MFRPELISFMKLLDRSEDKGQGSRTYSHATANLVSDMNTRFPGLFLVDGAAMTVSLTDEGKVLNKWMNFKPTNKVIEQDEDEDSEE